MTFELLVVSTIGVMALFLLAMTVYNIIYLPWCGDV